ncbi:MAG: MTH938/NDUFAF3 family protein [Desulfobacterales bacterium]|nr:MTH938/NDUFAF3 family protein [Desulfobacterales bacterium]
MITSYNFGRMTIGSEAFTSDLIIFPDKHIQTNWYRKAGHMLERSDLETLLPEKPELIIVGTGANGRMSLAPGLLDDLSAVGVEIQAMATGKAVSLFNKLIKEQPDKKISACFHLTC